MCRFGFTAAQKFIHRKDRWRISTHWRAWLLTVAYGARLPIAPPYWLLAKKSEALQAAFMSESRESYLHRCACDVVQEWCEADVKPACTIERELVLAKNSAGQHVATKGSYADAIEAGLSVIAIIDVALVCQDSGRIMEAIEVVHTSWPSPYKMKQMNRLGITVRIVEAQWVLKQSGPPVDGVDSIGFVDAASYCDAVDRLIVAMTEWTPPPTHEEPAQRA